jgi:hypothetical protein
MITPLKILYHFLLKIVVNVSRESDNVPKKPKHGHRFDDASVDEYKLGNNQSSKDDAF